MIIDRDAAGLEPRLHADQGGGGGAHRARASRGARTPTPPSAAATGRGGPGRRLRAADAEGRARSAQQDAGGASCASELRSVGGVTASHQHRRLRRRRSRSSCSCAGRTSRVLDRAGRRRSLARGAAGARRGGRRPLDHAARSRSSTCSSIAASPARSASRVGQVAQALRAGVRRHRRRRLGRSDGRDARRARCGSRPRRATRAADLEHAAAGACSGAERHAPRRCRSARWRTITPAARARRRSTTSIASASSRCRPTPQGRPLTEVMQRHQGAASTNVHAARRATRITPGRRDRGPGRGVRRRSSPRSASRCC